MFPEERLRASNAVLENLRLLNKYRESRAILFYLSLEEEVQTDEIIEKSIQIGRQVCVPVIDHKELRVARISRLDMEYEENSYGVREPRRDSWDLIDPTELDLVLVPGLAFDPEGGRIGFGCGYYDRFLSRLSSDVIFAGLAFDFQIVETAPQSPGDCKVHFVVTDKQVYDCLHPPLRVN
tara:strand:- start:560 stop:1099 length:540 start_codon:yes stop_codon:yes gene_type:complete